MDQSKATGAASLGVYLDLDLVEALDPLTARLTFKQPTGRWYVPFTGTFAMIVPRHALQGYVGTDARNAPFQPQGVRDRSIHRPGLQTGRFAGHQGEPELPRL